MTGKERLSASVDSDLLEAGAAAGDDIITSDNDDLRGLAATAGVHVELIQA